MAVRYFQVVNWKKWNHRCDYKWSMPWVKLSTRFFEDPKLDGLRTEEMLGIIWLITEAGRQAHGEGQVRVDEDSMRSRLGLRYYSQCTQILNTILRKGVIISISDISQHGSVAIDLDLDKDKEKTKKEDKNFQFSINPKKAEAIMKSAIKGKEIPDDDSIPF